MQRSSMRLASLCSNVPRRILRMFCLCCLLMLAQGCSQFRGTVRQGWSGQSYENTYLSATSPLGSKALNNWRDLDIDVRHFLKEHRDPDVVYCKYMEVTFFYLQERVQVRFIRPAVGFKTTIEQATIPEALYQQLRQRF